MTCRGPLASDCLSCKSNSIYDPAGRTCTCPSGFYFLATSADCLGCHISCLTCADGTNGGCRSCKLYASIVIVGSTSTCACNQGYQMNLNGDCAKINCQGACSVCSTDQPNGCITCKTYSTLLNGACKCNAGYYLANNDCLPCHSTCFTCNQGNINSCLSCKTNGVLMA